MRRAGAFLTLVLLVLTIAPPMARAATLSSRSGTHQWSEGSAWVGRKPARGDVVRIPANSTVVLDTSPPALAGLQVDGTLVFARKNINLTARWIVVHGTFRVDTEADPFLQRATITLTGPKSTQNIMGMGTKLFGVMGGTLDLHGRPAKSWTKLTTNVARGTRMIYVADATGWRIGQTVVIASSDYSWEHDEVRRITSVSGNGVQLNKPLAFRHWGRIQYYGGRALDQRAEVGLLTRNIVVRGDDSSAKSRFGGHLMVMGGGAARIENVEFFRTGQFKILKRYPIHFHMDGGAPDSYVRNTSVHKSFNRCVTIHGTKQLRVEDNVCFDHLGHGYFLEDGAEWNNVITGNLGLGTKAVENGILPTDKTPATFWITNPDNVVDNNASAGSEGFGFWYALPEHPLGLSKTSNIWPRRTPLGSFNGNTAHSNGRDGVHVDHGPEPNGETKNSTFTPVIDPTNEKSAPVVAHWNDITSYMNRAHGVWIRAWNSDVANAAIGDNQMGLTFADQNDVLHDSVIVGESGNPGTPGRWEKKGPNGSALPYFWAPQTPIVGFEFYDGEMIVRDTTFFNLKDNYQRPAAALSYFPKNGFTIHPDNHANNVAFVNSERVYFRPSVPRKDGDRSKVFIDTDGSVTGSPGRSLVVNNPFLLTGSCSWRAEWNARLCDGDYVTVRAGTTGSASAIHPLTLVRTDGPKQTLFGCCASSKYAESTVIPGRAYSVRFNGATPRHTNYVLRHGENRLVYLRIKLGAGFSVTRYGRRLNSLASLGALNNSGASGYFYQVSSSTLHLKLVGGSSPWEEVHVVRN